MIGERLFPHKYGGLALSEGAYGRDLRGRWWVRPPGESLRRPLEAVRVVEHPDGTITFRGVVNGGLSCFALERGVWTIL
jgi:hypothetical protein